MTLPMHAFSEAMLDVSAGNSKLPQSSFLTNGMLPVVDQGQQLIAGYTDDESLKCRAELPVIVFGDHTRALKYVDFPFVMGADGVKVLRVREGWDTKYVFHYLRSKAMPSAGYSRHFKFLKELSIPKPPLDEQRRVASIIDRSDALVTKRRESLGHLDDLPQSLFLELFGDPAVNPHAWPIRPLGSLATRFSDGPFGSNLKRSHYVDQGVRVVRLQNIGVGRFLDNDRAFVTREHFEHLVKHRCLPGDVLIGTLGEPNLRACIQPQWLGEALNKADCVQMRVDRKVATSAYVCGLLNTRGCLRLANSLVLGQTRLRISMGRLRQLRIPVPPRALQVEYEARLEAIEGMRQRVLDAYKSTDELLVATTSTMFTGGA